MKKVISIITTVILVMSTIIAFAADDTEYEVRGDFEFVSGTNEIVGYVGNSDTIEIPEGCIVNKLNNDNPKNITTLIINKDVTFAKFFSRNYVPLLKNIVFKEGITLIPEGIFSNFASVNKITLPSTLEKIGDRAFYKCLCLNELSLPEGLTEIGKEAFYGCSHIDEISFPDSLKIIGDGAFANTGLSGNLHFPDSIEYIGNFSGCKFDRIYLPDTIEYWGGAGAKTINIPDSLLENPPHISSAEEIIFNGDITLDIYRAVKSSPWCKEKYLKGKTDKSTGDYDDFIVIENAIVKYTGNDKNVIIPDGITRITQHAFRGADIDTVTFSDSVEVIEQSAFYETALKEVIIPKNVKEIGDAAFDYCPMITKVIIEGAPVVGESVFSCSGGLNEEFGIFEANDPNFTAPEEFYNYQGISYTPWAWYYWFDKNDEIPGWMFELEESPATSGVSELIALEKAYKASKAENKKDDIAEKPEKTDTNKNSDKVTDNSSKENINTTPISKEENEDTTSSNKAITVWSEKEQIKIAVGDTEIEFPDAKPFIDTNNRTLSPIRAISEAAGFNVLWDGKEQKVTISKDENTIILYIGSPLVSVNEKAVTMDTKAQLINGRTYLPVRFIGETLGFDVIWK